jgi:hypothetical protein
MSESLEGDGREVFASDPVAVPGVNDFSSSETDAACVEPPSRRKIPIASLLTADGLLV